MKPYNKIILADSRDLHDHVDDNTVSLIVTSPPYNVEKSYEIKMTLEEYLAYLDPVWKECLRVLKPGGRIVINQADTYRQPYIPQHAYTSIRLVELGFYMRGVIIWNKMNSSNRCTAWGSWMSPSNPYIRDKAEFICCFSKGNVPLKPLVKGAKPDITRDEFLEYSLDMWDMETESAKYIGHPAPFPIELPKRAIKFYTYPGDLVIDPFNGSGTTCVAAKMLRRKYLGFDILQEYVDLAMKRVDSYRKTSTL